MNRTLIALLITFYVLLCLHVQCIALLFCTINIALFYDCWYMWIKMNINKIIILVFATVIMIFHFGMLAMYYSDFNNLLKIVVITQTSDVFQYIAGVTMGKCKIGWVSKNKTYEGYVIGYIITLVTFVSVIAFINGLSYNVFINVSNIYFLGVLGGLISSVFKRLLAIKDYSDLLGSHGGWVDRIDSIVIPLCYYSI